MLITPSAANGGILLGNPINQEHPLNKGRLFWYRAMRAWTGGGTWYDLCGSYNGTFQNSVTWSPFTNPGGSGSLHFDGVSAYVKSANTTITGSGGHSFFAWVYPTNDSVSVQSIVSIGADNDSGNTIGLGYDNGIGTGNPSSPCFLEDGSTNVNANTSLKLPINKWSFVGYTLSGATVNLWVNGSTAATGITGGTCNSGNPILVGVSASLMALGGYWNGYISEVSFWNRVLSNRDILQLYDLSQRAYPGVLNRQSNIFYSLTPPPPISLTASYGTFTLTGEAATPTPEMVASNGGFGLTGEPTVESSGGTFSLTGQAATPTPEIDAADGTFTLTGENANLNYYTVTVLSGSYGTFSLTGQAATPTPEIDAADGTFALTGESANLGYFSVMSAGYGSFSLTGENSTPTPEIDAADGSYTLAGEAATLSHSTVMSAAYGTYTLTGESAFLNGPVGTGYFTLTGQPVNFAIRLPTPNGVWRVARSKIWTVDH